MDIAPIVAIVVGVAGSETRSNQLSMVKNVYLDTKINLYDAREMIYIWKWPWTMLALLLLLVYI